MKNWAIAFIAGMLLGEILVMAFAPTQRVYIPMYYERR